MTTLSNSCCGQSSSTNEDARTSRLELQNTKTIFSGEYLDEITSEMVEDFKSARKHEARRKAKDSRLVTGTTVNRALETQYNRSSELMRIIRKLLKKSGAPGEIRTPDPLVRSQMLYPAELRARSRWSKEFTNLADSVQR